MTCVENKKTFYPKVVEALVACGYEVADEIPGKGRSHASKPDYIAMQGSVVVIGEIKSPAEGPLTRSWRVPQQSDTEEFTVIRLDVDRREKQGLITKEAGGHEIIILGQIPDYLRKAGKTYDLPAQCRSSQLFGGYSAPSKEARNIEHAFSNCGKCYLKKILHANGTATYIYPL
jgi:hypothetical protein